MNLDKQDEKRVRKEMTKVLSLNPSFSKSDVKKLVDDAITEMKKVNFPESMTKKG